MRIKLFALLTLLLWSGVAEAKCKLADDYGLVTYNLIAAASDNHANIFPSPGIVCHIAVANTTATPNYLRLYNAGAAFNGCNSATNMIAYIPISGLTTGVLSDIDIPDGLAFSTGISLCVSGAAGFTDTTNATSATAISVLIGYAGR